MSRIRTLGILTSGGDCAGLNAAIRAVARAALREGWRTHGIFDGSLGLMESPPRSVELDLANLDRFNFRDGGTALGTVNRGDPFRFPMPDGSLRDRSADFVAGARTLGLDALAVIGGDGSMRILARLCEVAGLPMVGIPKTIDNDVPGTDYAIGFWTAVQIVSEAIDRLQPTAASHHRVMVLEVMGRGTGHIALNGGIAGGADAILMPEFDTDWDALTTHLQRVAAGPRRHALVVVAEGLREGPEHGTGEWVRGEIERRTGVESRCVVLGHLQRGGTPHAQDRLLASAFGVHAVELLAAGDVGRMVAWREGRVSSVALADAVQGPCLVAPDAGLVGVARRIGTYVGEPASR
jgi:ATP-dependent phosphofructokinase / diphosphate-dependent phosphofructokinase